MTDQQPGPIDMDTATERRFYVYAYLRKDGTPYYIGKGKGRRIDSPKGRAFKLPPKGRRKVLVGGLTEPEAFEYEIALIHCLGRKDLGTGCLRNLTDGGEGASGYVASPETRAKLSKALRNPSPEYRARMSAARTGRKHSPETRAKLSAAKTGSKHSPETRAKIGAFQAGRVHSPEHRAKNSAAQAGRKLSPGHRAKIGAAMSEANKGRAYSPETRAKLSAAQKAREAAKRAQRDALRGQLSLLLQGVAA